MDVLDTCIFIATLFRAKSKVETAKMFIEEWMTKLYLHLPQKISILKRRNYRLGVMEYTHNPSYAGVGDRGSNFKATWGKSY
jgi:hypothetical protein